MTKQSLHIPEFTSVKEEAEFWDKHDLTDFMDEFHPVEVKVSKELKQGITVRFDPTTLKRIRQTADEKGLGTTTLIRMWVMEKLDVNN